MYTVSQFLTYF